MCLGGVHHVGRAASLVGEDIGPASVVVVISAPDGDCRAAVRVLVRNLPHDTICIPAPRIAIEKGAVMVVVAW